jgi:ribosomal-protein-alanine N-acetyltransferase
VTPADLGVPLVILDDDSRTVGTVALQSVIRGFLQSCSVGYWPAEDAQGRGLATAALADAVRFAFERCGCTRSRPRPWSPT